MSGGYAADKQTNSQTNRRTRKSLPTPTDIIGVAASITMLMLKRMVKTLLFGGIFV